MAEIKSSGRPIDQLLEKVLCMNILSSDYFRDLLRLKTYHEVIDEIYVTVTHVEPWMTGNCRGPSTAFCLLYKFFTMKLTVKQMHGLLKHPDSPYIRAVGFLYLRYVADPKTLWSWYEPYLKDDELWHFMKQNEQVHEAGNVLTVIFKSVRMDGFYSSSCISMIPVKEFSPGSSGRMTTMGVYVRDLLLGQYYFDTLFPRIPVPVMRTIVSSLESMKLPTKHCGVTGETTRGSEETARRPPSVKAALSVSFGQRAPHRASTRDSSPVRRTIAPSYDRDDDSRRSPNRRRSQSRDLSDREYSDRERDRQRERERRDRERDRDRDRDRDRRYDYDRRSRDSYRRDYYDGRDRDQHYHGSRRSRSRSRSRSQSAYDRSTGQDQNRASPSRNGNMEKTSASSNLAKLKDLYGDLGSKNEDTSKDKGSNQPGGTEEVIRLGGSSWR
ncbi:pre-mRNA-splicing factor 38b [Phtheirospermum japonicum]|uniref:Pre-mRNA-splicing factor 38 n=1 Tax=Phtheirospermum japonicum TaxID=374723 RepID=A0A830DJG3_9LAMI|nr:pre-mRNA-splicing factor 38b [Phtheirospermum japonicum]